MSPWRTVSVVSPTRVITGFIVSMVTNESSVISSSVMTILFPLEFVASIENVTFPFVSPDKTVVVNYSSATIDVVTGKF